MVSHDKLIFSLLMNWMGRVWRLCLIRSNSRERSGVARTPQTQTKVILCLGLPGSRPIPWFKLDVFGKRPTNQATSNCQ